MSEREQGVPGGGQRVWTMRVGPRPGRGTVGWLWGGTRLLAGPQRAFYSTWLEKTVQGEGTGVQKAASLNKKRNVSLFPLVKDCHCCFLCERI